MSFKRHHTSEYLFLSLYSFFITFLLTYDPTRKFWLFHFFISVLQFFLSFPDSSYCRNKTGLYGYSIRRSHLQTNRKRELKNGLLTVLSSTSPWVSCGAGRQTSTPSASLTFLAGSTIRSSVSFNAGNRPNSASGLPESASSPPEVSLYTADGI